MEADYTNFDVGVIAEPRRWPMWPFLPVKSRTEKDDSKFPLLGVMIDPSGVPPTLHHDPFDVLVVCLYDLPTDPEQFRSLPRRKYASPVEVVRDGWTVD